MARMRFLHWNIENLGSEKFAAANGAHLLGYIAQVAAESKANMISIIEVNASGAANLTSKLVPLLKWAYNDEAAWHAIVSPTTPNSEAYYLLWQEDNRFDTVANATVGGPNPIQGFGTLDINDIALPFPSRFSGRGGRNPYFAIFKTSDTDRIFSVIPYHAMFGLFSYQGALSLGLLRETKTVDDGAGNTLIIRTAIAAGDFNVDIIDSRDDYDELLTNVGPAAVDPARFRNEDEAKTSLKNALPPINDRTNPFAFRKHAYDNIFSRDIEEDDGKIVALLKETTRTSSYRGMFYLYARNFNRKFIDDYDEYIESLPPRNFTDAWRFVRYQISNHLPVFAAFDV